MTTSEVNPEVKKPRTWFFSTAKSRQTQELTTDEKSTKEDGLEEQLPESSSVKVEPTVPTPVAFTALFRCTYIYDSCDHRLGA